MDPFLRELCSNPDLKSRRSPAINRGYLARLLALEVSFERILLLNQVQQVLSLGAGFDSMFFRLLNSEVIKRTELKYFEVDYPESVHRKYGRIKKSPILKSFFTECQQIQDCYVYDQGLFNMIGCNMTHIDEFQTKLNQAGFDPNLPTVILTECSTTYITAEDCISLISFLNKMIKKFVFISYEQIRPLDDFGQIMTDHFEKRNSSLKCVKSYPTIEHHRQRFLSFGWDKVEIQTIERIWKQFMNDSEMKRLNDIEDFDEVPELMLKCLHYVLIIGIKGLDLNLSPFWTIAEPDLKCEKMGMEVETIYNDRLKCYGHTSWTLEENNKVFVLGGVSASQARHQSICCLESDFKTVLWTKDFEPLMFSASAVQNDVCFIFGGRNSPSDPKGELFKINQDGDLEEIRLVGYKPKPRWGHSLTSIKEKLYLIGGRDNSETFNEVIEVDNDKCKVLAKLNHGLYSHSTVSYGSKLVISGGLKEFSKCEVSENLIIFDTKTHTLEIFHVSKNVPRFAHTSHMTPDSKLLLVGGVNIYKQDIILTIIDMTDLSIIQHFESKSRLAAPLVQHCSRLEDKKIVIFGGGTNCFSFGMHVNPYLITIRL